VAACAATTVFAHGSSHPPQSGDVPGAGFVPIEQAQLVMHYGSERNWQTDTGEILICPWSAKARGYEMECVTKDKAEKNAWVYLSSIKVPGYEIAGVQYAFVGSSGAKQLLVYWRKIPEATTVTPATPASAPKVLNTEQITINAGKVVVQRKR
jgi:hypothetical protein